MLQNEDFRNTVTTLTMILPHERLGNGRTRARLVKPT